MVWGRRRRTEARRIIGSLNLPANLLETNDLVVQGRVSHRPPLLVPASVLAGVQDPVLLQH